MSADKHTTRVEYRELPGLPGYRFGSDGSYWGRWTRGHNPRLRDEWTRLSPAANKSGHVITQVKGDGFTRRTYLHILMAEAWHGPCPPGLECRHLDGIPGNNRPDNLKWGTRRENIEDMKRHSLLSPDRPPCAMKLTEDQVREVRRLHAAGGHSHRKLGAMFGVAHCTIGTILNRTAWAHVE